MLTLIALSAALLQDPPAPPPPEVRSHFVFMGASADGPGNIDADGDGQVTRDEFAAPLNDAFGKMDKDGDGRLSPDELAADRGPGDANVTLRRQRGSAVERFELRRPGGAGGPRLERDGERAVIFVEADGAGEEPHVVVRTRPQGGPAVLHLRGGRDGLDGMGEGRVVVRTVGGPGQGPDDLDKDGDGKVSEAEFIAPLRDAFTRMDADRSGYIEDGEQGDENQVHVFTRRIETHNDE